MIGERKSVRSGESGIKIGVNGEDDTALRLYRVRLDLPLILAA